MNNPRPATDPKTAKAIDDANRGLLAGWRGALDSATLGLADKGVAAAQATLDAAGGRDWGGGYVAARARQTAEDPFEEADYPAYRQAGEIVGAIARLLLTDGLTATPAAARIAFTGPRLAPDAASVVRFARPWAAAGGVGAGAAAGAGATALVNSALTGQPIDVEHAAKDAVLGDVAGLLGHWAGTQEANSPNWKDKGKFGEWLARQTSNILGDTIIPPPDEPAAAGRS